MGETENVVIQCYEALVVREHLPEEGALKLARKDRAGRMDEWLEVGLLAPGGVVIATSQMVPEPKEIKRTKGGGRK